MPYYPYIPSGTFILEVNPSGATPLISGGYTAATGATGVGGIYEASGFKVVDNFFFAHTTGNSADQDYLATGNPTNIALATGTGYVYGGDIRGTGDNYLALGTTTSTGLASEVEHFVGAYARYTDAAGKTLTGLISGGNGYYTGSYTTLPPLQEFTTILPDVDTGNLNHPSTGSGVHLFRDVTLTFSEIVDRAGATLETQDELQNNLFFNGFDIDILDITGGMVFTGYKSGLKSRSFSFTEQENINVFGTYTSDFGVRYSLQDQNGDEQVNEIYLYGNPLEIDFLYITDASGRYLSQSNASNFITTGSGADELFLTNRQYVTGEAITGGINIEFAFKNDPNYTEYGNSINVYGQTGSGEFARNSSNFIATIPLTKDQAGQTFQLTPKDGDAEGLITETDYYFQLVPESAISKGQVFTVGPHKIQPVEQDPRNAGQPLYNRGNQYLAGDLDVAGCVTGRCLTISTPSNPNTIETAGGNVGIGTVPGTDVGDPKLDINGNLEGIGTAGRVTGPGGVDYALSTDIPADDDTLQSVTDRGNTTSTPVTLGLSSAPTSPLTIITNAATDSGIDLYAAGSYGDQIITLGTDANDAGRLVVKDADGDDSVTISNDSSRGSITVHDDGGTVRTSVIVDSNNQGKMTLLDSSANESVVLSSDSNKRGKMDIYDAGGDSVVEIKADSSDEGVMSIKDALGAVQTMVQAHKSILSAGNSNIYSTGSVIVGGSGHIISGDYDAIAGGADNQISGIGGDFNFIGGGSGVDISESKFASSIGGENNDIVSGDYSIIAGGKNNLISGNSTKEAGRNVIGGGSTNSIKNAFSSIVAGGDGNDITGDAACIIGGIGNTIGGVGYSVIGGGEANTARGILSAILGGENNETSGAYAVVVGGDGNSASGDYSFVGNGVENKVSGDYSYAFGRKALIAATHSGAGVLADGQNRVHASSGDHTLNLDFASGVYIGGGGALYVSGNPVMTGAHTVEADTFQTVTDRGDTTTNSIEVAGKYLSGVTGVFSKSLEAASGTFGRGWLGVDPPVDGLAIEGKVGIGTNLAGSKVDVNGNVAIGSSFLGYGAPSNGLAVAGNVGIGTYSATNALDIYGAALIGQNYSSAGAIAPSNGMIVEGNVGVGTSSPQTALDVRGSISGYTGLFDDKVGIGTNSPQAALDVARDTDASGIIGRAQIGYVGDSDFASFAHVDFANATDYAFAQTSAGHSVINARDGYNIYVREGDANIAVFDGSTKDFYVNTDTLYVDASADKVGINTSTPSTALDVRGTISGYTGLFNAAEIGATGGGLYPLEIVATANNQDLIRLSHPSSPDVAGFMIGFTNDGAGDNNNATLGVEYGGTDYDVIDIQRSTRNVAIDGDTLYVDSADDRVGVGTDNPSYTLEVTESDASSLLSRFYNTSTTNGQGILIRAGETANANRILQCASRDDTKIMTVNSNGRVGIGADTTPDYNLDLGGDTSSTSNTFRINQNDGGTAIRIGAGGGSSDVTLLRVDGESTQHNGESDKSNFGFSLNYMGAGVGNANTLSLFCDDGGATNQVEGLTVTQEGQLGILDTSITGYASADLALTVGGPAQVMGHFSATSKSFLIDHPTKENKKLQYGSLEGPEHGVFVRGTTNKNVIKLPDYWKDLVHEDSITVTLTPLHTFQSLYVKSKTPEQIMVGGVEKSYDYVVYGERKDIDKLEVEI